MDRRQFLGGVTFGLLAKPPAAVAQQAGKTLRIGIMYAGSAPTPGADALRRGLAELGWIEGQNLLIENRYAEEQPARFSAMIAELISLKVDVLVVRGTVSAVAAKQATSTIPIVVPVMGDPVAEDLVASLARPGGNVTGLSMVNIELSAKRVELLKEILPRAKRVAALRDPAGSPTDVGATQAAACTLGLELQLLSVGRPEEFHGAFQATKKAGAEGLIVFSSAFFFAQRRRLVDLAAQDRLIAVWEHRDFAAAGGLLSYGPNLMDMNRRAAKYIDKILKGAKPADLPVEQPTKYELVINLKTAKTLGLTIPPSVLARADEVIE